MNILLRFVAVLALWVKVSSSQLVTEIIASDPELSQFYQALEVTNILTSLEDAGPFTVFVPTNDAFSAIDFDKYLEQDWNGHLAELVDGHISPGIALFTDQMTVGLQIPTNFGSPLTVTATGPFTINGIPMLTTDIVADNGVVHVIETLSLPPSAEDTILDIINIIPNFFNTISELIVEAGLEEVIGGEGPLTLFAPSEDAFAALEEGTLGSIRSDPDALADFLLYHVVPGIYTSDELDNVTSLTTASGQELPNPSIFFNIPDILASNGVLHIMEVVLFPEEETPAPTPSSSSGFDSENFPETGTIVDFLEANGAFGTLLSALNQTTDFLGLDGPGPLTLFAPTNFSTLPPLFLEPEWNSHLANVLSYHVVSGEVLSADLTQGRSIPTQLPNNDVTVTSAPDPLQVNDINIISADVQPDNGVIHVMEQVLLPPSARDGAVDLFESFEDFSTLVSLLNTAGLVDSLREEGPITVFAPTNDAFEQLPAGTLEELQQGDIELLRSALLYHVVPDYVQYADLNGETQFVTLQGANITLNTNPNTANGNPISPSDLLVRNGLVQVIDTVLLPPTPTTTAPTTTPTTTTTTLAPTTTPTVTPTPDADDNTLVDAILLEPERFSTLGELLEIANLTELLQGDGPYTVFAPTNGAFDALPTGTLDSLRAKPEPLADLLLYHVVSGIFLSSNFTGVGQQIPTVQGQDISVTALAPLTLNENAEVIGSDLVVSNGVLHVISNVMFPPEEMTTPPTPSPTTTGDDKCVNIPGVQVCCPPGGEAEGVYFFCRFL